MIWVKNIDRNAKKWKRPHKSSKNKMFIFGLSSTSDDRLSNLNKKHQPKHKKWKRPPLSSTSDDQQKIKCSFLDYYVQLLMIWATNVDQNTQKKKQQKRPPKSSKNKMFVFGLHSTSDDQPSNLSKKCQLKHKKTKKAP